MNILVIGNGGREHAIIWKIKNSPSGSSKEVKIFCTIGNPGIDKLAEPVTISPGDIGSLVNFARSNDIDFTVVGPEIPLSLGIADEFRNNGLKIFGPTKAAARLETSKGFAKDFMKRYGIPTAGYKVFDSSSANELHDYLRTSAYPLVIKADGLAGGKGVVICEDPAAAGQAVEDFFEGRIFGEAGHTIVIEDFLSGQEASVFAVTDGSDYILLPSAQDHKKILDDERGKNTGGMGSFAPANKLVDEGVLRKIKERIVEPVLNNMKSKGSEFKGCLYCGLMIDGGGDPYVVEFNARFGDPETQVVLPLIKSDFLELLLASAEDRIKAYSLEVYDNFYCSVVLASLGYPDKYETGKIISGLDKVTEGCLIFHAGTKYRNGDIVSAGGRVLNVVGKSEKSLKDAVSNGYKNVELINFENKYYRTDIGSKGI